MHRLFLFLLKRLLHFCVILTFLCTLHAEENNPYDLALFGGMPSSVVGGHVNAITGDYFINQVDHRICSHEPLLIQRSYSSRKGLLISTGWNYPFNHTIAYWDCFDLILVPEKSGVSLVYELDRESPRTSGDPLRFKLQECPGGLVTRRLAVMPITGCSTLSAQRSTCQEPPIRCSTSSSSAPLKSRVVSPRRMTVGTAATFGFQPMMAPHGKF